MQALALIKQPEEAAWRIEVRPETVAMVDYDKMRGERGEFITGVATFLQSAAPLAELAPNAVPTLIEMLKWAVAGFKGSQNIEGVLDRAIEQMMKDQQQQGGKQEEPSEQEKDGQLSAQEHKQDMELEGAKAQNKMAELQAKMQADMQEMQAEFQNALKVIRAEMMAAIQEEVAQGQAAMTQDDHETANQLKLKRTPQAEAGNGETAGT